MNSSERKAFTERMKWLRERLDKDDLLDDLIKREFSSDDGFVFYKDIPGIT